MDTNTITSNATPAEQPKKYIRTLAGDMAILKSGGTPDLVPLAESEPSPAERLVAASPVTSTPISEPELQPIQQPIPPFKPIEPTPIKTYTSDFSDRVKETHASTATILATEQDAAPQTYQKGQNSSRGVFFYIFAGVVFFVVGGFGAYFAYTHYLTQLEPIILAPTISAPIFVDEREQVSGTGATLLLAIEQSISRPLASGTVRFLYASNATSTDNSIFSALQTPAPNVLLRNLNASNSMAGVVNADGNQSPFFILSVTSYGDTFSGMLSWEPLMPRDLGALFPSYSPPISSTSTATSTLKTAATGSTSSLQATTTATSSTPAIIAGFRDEVVSNHDVRIYRDAENRSILLYGYWNQMTLIIARDPAAFAEILRRLASSHS